MVAFLGGAQDSFADVELDLEWCTGFQRSALEAMREIPYGETATYGEVAALAGHLNAQRAVGSVCAQNRFGLVVPCHRVVAADGLGSYGSLGARVQASATGARRCLCLRTSGTSSPGSRRARSATGSPSSRVSRIPRAACTCGGAARSRSTSTSRAPLRRGALSVCCASWASRPRSAPISDMPSGARRVTSSMSQATSRALEVLREAGVVSHGLAPLERPPQRVVARACCRAAYLRGALLGSGTLSGPRSPHLEVRSATCEGAEFVASVGERLGVQLHVLERGRHAIAYAKGAGADRRRARRGRGERRRARLRGAGRDGSDEGAREPAGERRSRESRQDEPRGAGSDPGGQAPGAARRARRAAAEASGDCEAAAAPSVSVAAGAGPKCSPPASKSAAQRRLARIVRLAGL